MEIMVRPRLIVFDFDGVLVDGTNEAYIACYTESFHACSIGIPDETIRTRILENWGRSAEMEIRSVVPEQPEAVAPVLKYYLSNLDGHLLAAATPIPGAVETVRRLASDYLLAIISGMTQSSLDRIVDRTGLRPYVRAVLSSPGTEDPPQEKHTGFHLRLLIESLRLSPNEALCVGDGPNDIKMSQSQGVPCLYIPSGVMPEAEARSLGALGVLQSIVELPRFLEQLPDRGRGQILS